MFLFSHGCFHLAWETAHIVCTRMCLCTCTCLTALSYCQRPAEWISGGRLADELLPTQALAADHGGWLELGGDEEQLEDLTQGELHHKCAICQADRLSNRAQWV